MSEIKTVTPGFAVAPQLAPADMAAAAAHGFTLVINNRPDGEAPGQPSGAEMAAAAEAAGLKYVAIPVRGGPTPDQVAAMRAVVDAADGPVLAYCRSGTRSIFTWSLGEAAAGSRSRAELIALGQAAGYDLTPALA
jgi:uncharacterized protein (TIGR01244 family)